MSFGSSTLLSEDAPSLFGNSSLLSLDTNPVSEPSSPPTTEHVFTPSPIDDDDAPESPSNNPSKGPSSDAGNGAGAVSGFRSNGLLGEEPAVNLGNLSPQVLNTQIRLTSPLGSTDGLLSHGSSTSFFNETLESESSSSKGPGATFGFRSNGLLGDEEPTGGAQTGFPTLPNAELDAFLQDPSGSDLLDQPQLPTISELFGANDLLSSSSSTKPPVRAMTFDGKAMFFKKKAPKRNAEASSSRNGRMGNLLDIPIHRLLDTLSYEKGDRLRREATTDSQDGLSPEDELWVDRYRPRKFTDLLGNERVARDTMAWVKQWDWCVFGRAKKGLKNSQKQDEKDGYQDEYHRPREKFLLLSGPPGLGKTTLAHVVARQAGYEVVEINASDARSGQIVDDRIRPTLEAGSTVGSTKPVMLVIDEIDGATGAGENANSFIHKLVQLTQVKPKKKQRNGKRDPGASRPLLRPIICICNDANASSIAKLRPHALQMRFNKPADIHVVKRLREICEIEELKADSRALTTLVGVAKGDLRGCLNTLQFIKADRGEVTESIVRKATVGMKESESSVQTVLDSLFNPLSKKRVKELGLTELDEGKYISRLHQAIDGCGRESAIATGCFGHYASLRNYDANLSRHEKAGEWLVNFDLLSASMYGDADFTLTHYLPYFLVPFYPLFQERGGERVERNQADWENLQTMRSNEEIYKSLSRGLRTAAVRHGGDFRHLCGSPIIQLEIAPILNRIISPPLRPVNSQIIKPDEKAVLDRLVNIMTAIELRFIRERSEEGTLSYRLDPPIDVFVTYDGKRASDLPVSRYAVRHIVAGEVDAKLYDRENDVIEKGKRGKHQGMGLGSANGKRARDDDDHGSTSPHKKSKVEIDPADKPPTDFFGRSITVTKDQRSKPVSRKGSNQIKGFRVSYKFAEGNSAAVRKPIKVACFL